MKIIKNISIVLAMICLLSSFAGCKENTASIDDLTEQNQQLYEYCYDMENRNADLTERLSYYEDKVKVNVSGGFSAMVFETSPAYGIDTSINSMATVSQFQSMPFLLWIGPEIKEFPEPQKIYFFEIESTPIEMTNYEYDNLINDPHILFAQYPIKIKSFRIATDDEWGLEPASNTLTFTKE